MNTDSLPRPKSVRQPRREWVGVYCIGERHQSACLSWFKPFVPESWGLPIAADIETEIETDRETAIRALFRLPNGRLKEALRRMNARSTKVTIRDASPAILNSPAAKHALAQIAQPEAAQ